MKTIQLTLVIVALVCNVAAAQKWGSARGEGPVVKQELDLDKFHSIGMSISGSVYLTQGNSQKVVVEAQQNIIDLLKKEVKNGSWNIGFEKNVNNYDRVKIYITVPTLKALSLAGSGDIIAKTPFNNLDALEMDIAGSGTIEMKGTANSASVDIAGSGDVKAADLEAKSVEVSIAGSGDCYIHAVDMLKVSVAGSGDVKYKGRPRVKTSIAGSGEVETMD